MFAEENIARENSCELYWSLSLQAVKTGVVYQLHSESESPGCIPLSAWCHQLKAFYYHDVTTLDHFGGLRLERCVQVSSS